jgi:5-methylcytosine-specific restriction endonuclease McrA
MVCYRHIVRRTRNGAMARSLMFDLPESSAIELLHGACSYCGRVGVQELTINGFTVRYNGIDRVDSATGYSPDNAVSCCVTCNRAKLDTSVDAFREWIRLVHSHLTQ